MIDVLYLISAVCFIFALRGLASADRAVWGNILGVVGMVSACIAAYLTADMSDIALSLLAVLIGGAIGIWTAKTISMTSLPQMIAGFHSLVGLSAVLISFAVYFSPELFKITSADGIKLFSCIEMGVGVAIGAVTFSGSVVAFCKLNGMYRGTRVPNWANIILAIAVIGTIICFMQSPSIDNFLVLAILSLIFGFSLISPIGGGDMPVIVSMLNSYSGWAASGIGFTLHNDLLIITGALVGASGAILSYIMCKGMNRSLWSVMFSPVQNLFPGKNNEKSRAFKQGAPEDAAFLLQNASSVIIVPGYGMATSQSQHALKEMGEILKKQGVNVRYAIHPVAGRMPGHMNVLLADAKVPYEDVFELDEINRDFSACDVAFVIGANDVTNPAAENDPTSPIYGMPILEVSKAKVVLFLKRSMGTGYSGIDNELFYAQNTIMLLGDAKKTTEAIVKAL